MRRRWTLLAPLAVAATLALAACTGSSTPAKPTPAGPSAESGVALDRAATAYTVPHAVPHGWQAKTLHGLSYALPPATGGGTEYTTPASDPTGYLTADWTGDPIPETVRPDTPGGGLAERVTVRVNLTQQWDQRIRGGSQQTFRASAPGASAVGGSITEQKTQVFDANGTVIAEQPVANIWIFVQAKSGPFFQINLITSPGDTGVQVLKQFLGALTVD